MNDEQRDALEAARILRDAGAVGDTLSDLAEYIVRRRPPRVREGDLVPVHVDLSPLTNCDVYLVPNAMP